VRDNFQQGIHSLFGFYVEEMIHRILMQGRYGKWKQRKKLEESYWEALLDGSSSPSFSPL